MSIFKPNATLMREVRRIFGHVQHPVPAGMNSGTKVLKKRAMPSSFEHYHLKSSKKLLGFHIPSDEEIRRASKLVRLRSLGKGPPKKGEGKRSKKKR